MGLLNQDQIVFHPENCLNLKKPFPRLCRECITSCPHQAISESKEVNRERCTECGVCMAVCPAEGFLDRDLYRLGQVIFADKPIILNCPMAEPLGYEIACLGMFNRDMWSVLLLQALKKEVRIITGECGKCEDRKACALSVGYLKELLEKPAVSSLLQAARFSFRIEVKPDSGQQQAAAGDGAGTGKRSWSLPGKERVNHLISYFKNEEDPDFPQARRLLIQALEASPGTTIPYQVLQVDECCEGCGVCAKICPQGALEQSEKEGKKRLIYEPGKCVHCQRCMEICGSNSLKMTYTDLSAEFLTGKVLLLERDYA